MSQIHFEEVSIASTKKMLRDASYIDNDLILIDDLASLPWPNEPRRLNCILLAFCSAGKVQYSVNTEEYMVRAGDAIIISEGTIADSYMVSRDLKGVGLMMSSNFFRDTVQSVHDLSQLFLYARTHPVFSLSPKEAEVLVNYYNTIKSKVDETEHHFRNALVKSIIMAMIYDISNVLYRLQQVIDKRQTRAESIFTSFIADVEKNFRSERRVSWYAAQQHITPKYLSETVKQVSRRTPNEWIDNYVVLELRVLLKNSTMSIKEITQHLNFPNQSFLGKYFKEHVGKSPSEYRKI